MNIRATVRSVRPDLRCSCKRSVFIECLFQLVMYCRKMWKTPTNYPFLSQKILEIRVLVFPETAYTVVTRSCIL